MGLIDQDFFKWRGDTFFIQITIADAETDLSGYKAYWSMALDETSSPVLVKTTDGDFSDEGGIEWVTDNRVRITLEKEDTDALTPGEYYHELAIEDGSGDSVIVSAGTFDLKQSLFEVVRNA